jgi:peptide/nickel transport system substrate-binding protein
MGVNPAGDVAAGQALIEAAGYTKNADGLYEKDGKVLSLNLIVHNSTIEYVRSNNEIVEQLRAGGIDASSQPLQDATADDARANGQFEASWAWDSCGSVNEPWNSLNHLSADFYVPIGQRASGNLNNQRWNTEGAKAYSQIVKDIGSLPLGDPKIVDMVVAAYKYIDAETPTIPLVQAPKLVPFDTTYWTNWPTQENNYNHPATWWNSTEQIILNLHKAGS